MTNKLEEGDGLIGRTTRGGTFFAATLRCAFQLAEKLGCAHSEYFGMACGSNTFQPFLTFCTTGENLNGLFHAIQQGSKVGRDTKAFTYIVGALVVIVNWQSH